MKKTFQINLGGVSFNIEEEAYAKLTQYIAALKKYFASYEGSAEIVEDIEARMAEKMYDKNKTAGFVGMDDVKKVIDSMGTLADFEAVKEEEDMAKEVSDESKKNVMGIANAESVKDSPLQSKYYKDGSRKVLGGVLAGLSHKFKVDVVWLRILFLVLSITLLETGPGGFLILAYVICWFVFPTLLDLVDDFSIKKFYRNPEHKVIGGVVAGLAEYLAVDIALLRFVFVLTGIFGIGIVLYVIFWIVAPNANSVTQKMEMKGKPLTIENIESSIKTNSEPGKNTESNIAKVLLFPFRIIGVFFGAFSGILKPVGSVFRILIGVFVFIMGLILVVASLAGTGMFFGIANNQTWLSGHEFFNMIQKDLSPIAGVFGFFMTFVPSAAISIGGLSIISNKKYGNKNFWLTTLILWFSGVIGVASLSSQFAVNFANKEEIIEVQNLKLPADKLILDADVEEFNYNNEQFKFNVRLNLLTSKNNELSLEKSLSATGKTDDIAIANAKGIMYSFSQSDSLLVFDDKFNIKGEKLMREQKVSLKLSIPKGKPFKITDKLANSILANRWDLENKYGINSDDISKYTFSMGDNDEILCADCPKLTEDEKMSLYDNNDNEDVGELNLDNKGEYSKSFQASDFNKVKYGGALKVFIKYADKYSVEAYSVNNKELDNLKIVVNSKSLEISYEDPFSSQNNDVYVLITCPKLEGVDVSGASESKILGFKAMKTFNLSVSGSSSLGLSIETEKLSAGVSGASNVKIKGSVNDLELNASGSSEVDAESMNFKNAEVRASGASDVSIGNVTGNYTGNSTGASKISKRN